MMNSTSMKTTSNNTLTAVSGIRVGHWTDLEAITGCTVILCPPDTVGGVDQRGGAPGTRETDLLRPLHLVRHVHAIVLSGGSAFGLASADGVMRYLAERKVGFPVAADTVVPIVPAAILFDLDIGSTVWPDSDAGYAAALAATADPVEQGSVGAGTGCKVGTLHGLAQASKGGIGSATVQLGNGLIVSALCAVNPFGDIYDDAGQRISGLRDAQSASTMDLLLQMMSVHRFNTGNTIIGVVATNARLDKEGANLVAQMGQDGLARAVRPAHTVYDGDTLFALATGEVDADASVVGAFAAEVVAEAIRNGVFHARGLAGVPAWHERPEAD
jgi:L-aminopeptidase/D-esterase-like protein